MRRVALALAVLLVAAGCGGSGSDVKTEGGNAQLTVGTIPIVDVAPIYLGKQKGFFAKQKINLTLKPATSGAVIIPSVISGGYQVGFSNYTSLLLAREKGLPLKVIANGDSSTGVQGKDFAAIVVPKASPIRSAKDLAGKRVSVNALKNVGDTTVRASIRQAGGDPSTVKFAEIPFADAPAALFANRIDAAFLVEPQLTQALTQGARVVASNFVDGAPNLSVAGYFVSEKVLKSEGDVVKRFTQAINESLTYANSHPDETRAVLKTYTKISPDLIPKLTLPQFSATINKASIETLGQKAVTDELLKKTPDYDAMFAEGR
jgi:NitT/TauT family transport system substrate-binding protein